VSLAWIIWLAAATAPAPTWEKVYERPGKENFPAAVWADGDGWFAAWPGLLVTGGPGEPRTQPMGARWIVAFSGASRSELYAVGWDELVLKLDGTRWIEEHLVTGPVREDRNREAALLEQVTPLLIDVQTMPAAVGPWQVLVRHPDGTWQALPEVPRQRVLALAHQGPKEARPAGCAPGWWSWVGKDRAVFSCHDRRAYLFESGKVTPVGRSPKTCKRLDRPRTHGSAVFGLCGGRLWRRQGDRWQSISGPGDLRDYAITDHCLYAVTAQSVWRRCTPRPPGAAGNHP
jgi:hypothetical protein